MYACMSVCIYMYVYICIYIHISFMCIYVYVYIGNMVQGFVRAYRAPALMSHACLQAAIFPKIRSLRVGSCPKP